MAGWCRRRSGHDNGPGGDLRHNIERDNPDTYKAEYSRSVEPSPEQYERFEWSIDADAQWGLTNTCANWSSNEWQYLTAEHLEAGEKVLGKKNVGTPRRLSQSIDAANKKDGGVPRTVSPRRDSLEVRHRRIKATVQMSRSVASAAAMVPRGK